jgi:hypothetical protein
MTFYFAWCAPEDAFSATHYVDADAEGIFGFEILHAESDFATLTVDLLNPMIGLLNEDRDLWAWFSWLRGPGDVVPLFKGRLVGIPQELQNQYVRLVFKAHPVGYEDDKEALAATLRVAPFWDPAFINEEAKEDPDTVLEARCALWHIDRVTHAVTISSMITGEDTPLEVTDHYYDSLSVTHGTPPARAARIKAQAVWNQQAWGTINLTSQFPSPITSYTWQGLMDDWPKPGDDIGGGWQVEMSNDFTILRFQAAMNHSTTDGGQAVWSYAVIQPLMICNFEAEREFAETAEITLLADTQALVTDAGDGEFIDINLSAEVDQPVDAGDEMPIGTAFARRYFQTVRGRQSIDYLLALARAQLLYRARAVEISFDMKFADGVDLSCRKSVTIVDPRIPGGEAFGKVKSYALKVNGDSGEAVCNVTIGCTIGNGGTVAEVVGEPTYVEVGYVTAGYQVMAGSTREVIGDDLTIEDYSSTPINDDGIDWEYLTPAQMVEEITVTNQAGFQAAQVPGFADLEYVAAVLNLYKTTVLMDLRQIEGGPFETTFAINVSELKIPKYIDLAAEAA